MESRSKCSPNMIAPLEALEMEKKVSHDFTSPEIANVMEARLLVVDDDLIQRKIISKLGAQVGFVVTEASSFSDAEILLKRENFDCITLDLSLGEHNGMMLLKTMVEAGVIAPIIVISGADEEVLRSTVGLALSLNITAVSIAKPLKITELRDALADRLRHAAARISVDRVSSAIRSVARGIGAGTLEINARSNGVSPG